MYTFDIGTTEPLTDSKTRKNFSFALKHLTRRKSEESFAHGAQ